MHVNKFSAKSSTTTTAKCFALALSFMWRWRWHTRTHIKQVLGKLLGSFSVRFSLRKMWQQCDKYKFCPDIFDKQTQTHNTCARTPQNADSMEKKRKRKRIQIIQFCVRLSVCHCDIVAKAKSTFILPLPQCQENEQQISTYVEKYMSVLSAVQVSFHLLEEYCYRQIVAHSHVKYIVNEVSMNCVLSRGGTAFKWWWRKNEQMYWCLLSMSKCRLKFLSLIFFYLLFSRRKQFLLGGNTDRYSGPNE